MILGTAPGERPMRPEFGCGIHDYIFESIDGSRSGASSSRSARHSIAGSRAPRSLDVDPTSHEPTTAFS